MPEINTIKSAISALQQFNDEYVKDKVEKNDGSNKLNEHVLEIERIENALKIKPAIGVFGASQCGKSFLVSELSGGESSKLNIVGQEDKNFQDFNQQHADTETTAVVTRLTKDKYENAPTNNVVLLKLLNPSDIMWGFVYGFYSELKYSTGFELSEDQETEIKDNIDSTNATVDFLSPTEKQNLFSGFASCINHIKENYSSEHIGLAEYANRTFNDKTDLKMGLDQIVLYISTLWRNDPNISKAFRTMMLALQNYNFADKLYLPIDQLAAVLNVASMETINLEYKDDDLPKPENNILQFANDQASILKQVGCIQPIVKEVVLPIQSQNNDLINKLDILDFPGARAGSDQQSAEVADDIEQDIFALKGKSSILANVYQRGRLLYLFALYCKNYDITLLAFCSENGNQEARISKKMIEDWIAKHASEENDNTPDLFAVFTKSDKLLKQGTVEQAQVRLNARFSVQFSDYYGSWINKWPENGRVFQNIFFVRNPQVRAFPYQLNEDQSEGWINEGQEIRNTLYQAWSKNQHVQQFLMDSSEDVFNSVFEPGNNGLDRLIKELINKYNNSPNRKKEQLDARSNDVVSELKNYINKYYTPDPTEADQIQRNEALEFISSLEAISGSVSTLVNSISTQYPIDKVLEDIVVNIKKKQAVGNRIFSSSPLKDALDGYISFWLAGCLDSDIHQTIGIQSGEMTKYLDNITKYLISEDVLGELKEDLPDYFEDNPNDIRQLNKYVKWICCDYLYHLGEKNGSELPHSPIKISETLELDEFQNNILEKWRKRLPDIYAGFYTPAPENPGNHILTNVHNNLFGA